MSLNTSITLEDLEQLIDEDKSDHHIKEMGILLVAAMRDWPSIESTNISTFLEELKDFYGAPITLEKIENKQLDGSNGIDLWKHEAGAAIAEILELSEKSINETNLDAIIQKIIDYYKRDYHISEIS